MPSTEVRGKGFSLYGAISPCLKGNGYFEIHKSTNSEDHMTFMRNIQDRIRASYRQKRLALIFDNHKAHFGEKKREIYAQFAEEHPIPVYSCELNGPIETAWSVIKARVVPKITQLQLQKQCTREKCIEAVKEEISLISSKTWANLCRAHYATLSELLQQRHKDYYEWANQPAPEQGGKEEEGQVIKT